MELTTRARSTARRVARSSYTAVSRATVKVRMQPTFLIAGAQRCGTTSLFQMLAKHPDVQPPAITKGVHYFDTANRHARGSDFYRAHFPMILPNRQGRITGEASPYYIFHPLAAERIAQELPKARIIVLLRDPVERAYSAHKQETWRGFETLPFEEALEAEPERLAGEEGRIITDPGYQSFSHQHHAYVGRGMYAPQLQRMAQAVGRDNLLVLDADHFFADPSEHWASVLRHIGLPFVPLNGAVKANARPSAPMASSVRARLERAFESSDASLNGFLGHPPSWV